MSKIKTRKAAAKRMTVTGGGKLKRRRTGLTHLQSKRSSRTQERNNDAAQSVAKSDYQKVKRMLAL